MKDALVQVLVIMMLRPGHKRAESIALTIPLKNAEPSLRPGLAAPRQRLMALLTVVYLLLPGDILPRHHV
ncbi:MAG: hypothetical protein ACI8S6_003599, partial [Myxococcota bacterium]